MSEVKRYDMKTTYRGHESWDSLEEDKDGGYVNYEDYAALEAKCAALAALVAENAERDSATLEYDYLNDQIEYWKNKSINITEQRNELAAENAGLKAAAKETLAHWAAAEPSEMEQMMDKCMPNLRIAYCETPATDAFLAEVRAQGVDSAINTVIAMMNHQHPVTSKAIDILRVHAYQIRKGVQS